MPSVAITGAGTINALAGDVDSFRRELRETSCAIRPLQLFDTEGYRSSLAAEVKSLAVDWLPKKIQRRGSRSDLLALIAAREALDNAQLSAAAPAMRENVGIIVGASTGGMLSSEEYYRRTLSGEKGRRPRTALVTPVSTTADFLAQTFACYGPRFTVSTACSSGANALGLAADWIRSGQVSTVLCGGVDSLCKMTFSGFCSLQAVDRVPCRPFDRNRAGLSLGEGAAFFVLEDSDVAASRGVDVWAEFAGYGVSADAFHMTKPRDDGASALLALDRAFADAAIEPEEIDYINAHGTATPANDSVETRVLKSFFGRRAYDIPVSSSKSMIGHCLAAAGAIEALISIIAMQEQFLPATANLVDPDPECDLDFIPNSSRPATPHTVLSNSYGFGGNNTSLILRHPDSR